MKNKTKLFRLGSYTATAGTIPTFSNSGIKKMPNYENALTPRTSDIALKNLCLPSEKKTHISSNQAVFLLLFK